MANTTIRIVDFSISVATAHRAISSFKDSQYDVRSIFNATLMSQVSRKKSPAPTPSIVFLATAWGSEQGGINSLNYDLCRALAKQLDPGLVACLVPCANHHQLNDARESGVFLVSLDGRGSESFDIELLRDVEKKFDAQNVRWWIGHDIITGSIAQTLSKQIGQGKVAAIMHQSYADYSLLKAGTKSANTDKSQAQQQLFSSSDLCFAVGPLLEKRLRDYGVANPKLLIPGLQAKSIQRSRSKISALIMGRIEPSNVRIKGTYLALTALADAIHKIESLGISQSPLLNTTLKIIGAANVEETQSSAHKIIEERAGKCFPVEVYPFLDKTAVESQLEGVNLCFMTSWHEGFGLVGWEAIGAGIPLILSRNSGLCHLLNDIGGQAIGCVKAVDIHGSFNDEEPYQDEDVEKVRKAITEIASDIDRAQRDAETLRRLLITQENFTWEQTARSFALELKLNKNLVKPRISTLPLQKVAPDYVAFLNDIPTARQEGVFKIAQVLHRTGYYSQSLEWIDKLPRDLPELTAARRNLLRAEILLRLNLHDEAEAEAKRALNYFKKEKQWPEVIEAEGTLNTLLRVGGQYELAVKAAKSSIETAKKYYQDGVGKPQRDLARSLALTNQWEEAVKEAREALTLATGKNDVLDQAKSYLALGEAHRHGFSQREAISAYIEAVKLSVDAGHYDCLLWSSICLADSYFLTKQDRLFEDALKPVEAILKDTERLFPLETLHFEITIGAMKCREGEIHCDELKEIVVKYEKLGVQWPKDYLKKIEARDYSTPKSF